MLTEEQKQKRRDSLAKARAARKAKRAEFEADTAVEDTFPAQVIVPGEIEEPDDAPAVIEPQTPFGRFLETLDAETRDLLDEADLRAIFNEQQAKAKAERRVAVKKAAEARALEAARIAEGVIAPKDAAQLAQDKRLQEKVRFKVDLPELGDIGLRVDQHIFLHGHTYTVTRAQFESMLSTVYQSQQAELAFDGKDRMHWLRRREVSAHIGGNA